MKKDLVLTRAPQSSFLSCEKDTELILRKLFIESRPFNEQLIRLLTIQRKDCLETQDPTIVNAIKSTTLKDLLDKEYVRLTPKVKLFEHEEVKAYIIITFESFVPSGNPEFRDCIVTFEVVCHNDYWDIGNYRQRPFKIMGYIDGILNDAKLSGIGRFQFAGATELLINEDFSGYTMQYMAIHGSDDMLEPEE